ncbi:MAG: hypothetical protein IJ587_07325 [Synergistaceae bacterium]|nr:hypothetical protein [Synergistaceae bacterium]
MSAEYSPDYDTEVFGRDELYRIPETVCAFANSSGGRAVCEYSDPSEFVPEGIPYVKESEGVIYVPPLAWNRKPFVLKGRVYRRIEGVNVISGRRAKSIMAGDSHESSRDDRPFTGRLNEEPLRGFWESVTALNEGMKGLTITEFMRRTGIYSGKYLTFAGALMLGEAMRVRAVLDFGNIHIETGASNIWDAYSELLPRLVSPLSEKCSEAFREVFINALLHSDYNAGRSINVHITSSPPKVLIDNPGTIRGTIRNHRLAKMFALSGITQKNCNGLPLIRRYMPSFELRQDMLTLRVSAMLELEGRTQLPSPVIL